MPFHASQLYARNLTNFVKLALMREGRLDPTWDDDVVRATLIARDGQIVHPRVLTQLEEVAVS